MGSVNLDQADLRQSFALNEGGPGDVFVKRLHLINPRRSAPILMALTWVPLFALCMLQGLCFSGVKIPFFYDIAVHTRFLVAVPVLILADIPIGVRLREVMAHFVTAHLVPDEELGRFEEIILNSLRFRDSRAGGIIVVVLAYLATYNAVTAGALQSSGTWFRLEPDQGLTPAGYWYVLVSLPIFQFLIFRWIYRMAVWSRFLWKVSKLDLILTPTHPDGAGGLAFMGKSLIPFGLILFALSATVASSIAERILFMNAKLEEYLSSYVTLFVIALVVFSGPMLLFLPNLLKLKQRGLMEYGTLGSEYTQAFHQRWVAKTAPGEEPLLGSADIQSLADLGNSFVTIKKMNVLPVGFSDFVAFVLPGLIPALPLAATVMPLGDILKGLLKLIA